MIFNLCFSKLSQIVLHYENELVHYNKAGQNSHLQKLGLKSITLILKNVSFRTHCASSSLLSSLNGNLGFCRFLSLRCSFQPLLSLPAKFQHLVIVYASVGVGLGHGMFAAKGLAGVALGERSMGCSHRCFRLGSYNH